MGLLVITDAMINRVSENYKKGKRTHIFIDEIHVLFENEYSATFFNSACQTWLDSCLPRLEHSKLVQSF